MTYYYRKFQVFFPLYSDLPRLLKLLLPKSNPLTYEHTNSSNSMISSIPSASSELNSGC